MIPLHDKEILRLEQFGYRQLSRGLDVHTSPRPVEANLAINERKDCVIASKTHVLSREKLRSALPDDDIARDDCFAPKSLHAKTFADAVPSVLYAALSFFMCHSWKLRVEGLMVESG
jgi:hypothetical protein